TDNKMIYMEVPTDKNILAGLGALTIRNSQLDHSLQMTIRLLADLSVEETLDATKRNTSGCLRERIDKLAKKRLRESAALLKLQAILERARKVTDKRNQYVHSLWARELYGPAVIRKDDHSFEQGPSSDEL